MHSCKSTLVIGIGNLLWADEGFGVRAVEALHRRYAFDDDVTLLDGGTQGLYLVHHIEAADRLVILDAIDYGLPPSTLKLIEGDDVPSFLGAKKMSLHQTGFQEVLAMADMLGRAPRELFLVGVQPLVIEDYGGSLSPTVKAQIEPALAAALSWLAERGVQAVERDEPLPREQSLAGSEVDMKAYEAERPSQQAACRVGDDRVLGRDGCTVGYRPEPLADGAVRVDLDGRKHA